MRKSERKREETKKISGRKTEKGAEVARIIALAKTRPKQCKLNSV